MPLVTQNYPREVAGAVAQTARAARAELFMRGHAWGAELRGGGIEYYDCYGPLALPLPSLVGVHQADNAALAVAMLRHQDRVRVSSEAMAAGIVAARWPARLQLLGQGPLTALVPGRRVWLDGGHNPDAGAAIARHFAGGDKLHLIIGMLANKDASALVAPLADQLASITAVPVPGHDCHPASAFGAGARGAERLEAALCALPHEGDVLIAGSLYLAGEVLRLNLQAPV